MRRSGNDPGSQRAAVDTVGHGQSPAMPESMLGQAEGNVLIEMRGGEDFPFGWLRDERADSSFALTLLAGRRVELTARLRRLCDGRKSGPVAGWANDFRVYPSRPVSFHSVDISGTGKVSTSRCRAWPPSWVCRLDWKPVVTAITLQAARRALITLRSQPRRVA